MSSIRGVPNLVYFKLSCSEDTCMALLLACVYMSHQLNTSTVSFNLVFDFWAATTIFHYILCFFLDWAFPKNSVLCARAACFFAILGFFMPSAFWLVCCSFCCSSTIIVCDALVPMTTPMAAGDLITSASKKPKEEEFDPKVRFLWLSRVSLNGSSMLTCVLCSTILRSPLLRKVLVRRVLNYRKFQL